MKYWGEKLTLRDPVSWLLVVFPPELLASSSDKDSRLSVDWPLIIRILGDGSSWKLCRGGGLLFGEVRCFPLTEIR